MQIFVHYAYRLKKGEKHMKVTIETQTTSESRMVAKMVEIMKNSKTCYVQFKPGCKTIDAKLLYRNAYGSCAVLFDDEEEAKIAIVSEDQVTIV